MIDLSGFTTFDFREGVPYISVTGNGVTFNKSVIMKMGYPEHVLLLINEANKQIVIQRCSEQDDKAASFYKAKESNVLSVRWNAKDLINRIVAMTGWDLSMNSYRVYGQLIPDMNLMLFELDKAVAMT